jgi:hypothetical protein
MRVDTPPPLPPGSSPSTRGTPPPPSTPLATRYPSVSTPGMPRAFSRFAIAMDITREDTPLGTDLPPLGGTGTRNALIDVKQQITGGRWKQSDESLIDDPSREYKDNPAQALVIQEFRKFMRKARLPCPASKPVLVAPRTNNHQTSYTYVTVAPAGLVSPTAWDNISAALFESAAPEKSSSKLSRAERYARRDARP